MLSPFDGLRNHERESVSDSDLLDSNEAGVYRHWHCVGTLRECASAQGC